MNHRIVPPYFTPDNMLDRTLAPHLSTLALPQLLPFQQSQLSNGIPVFCLHDPSQKVFRLDVSFEAGAYYQPAPLIASSMMHLLNEGTPGHTSAELAETFDYYGAYTDFTNGLHRSEASLFSLTRYAPQTLQPLSEMIMESIFPEKELEISLKNRQQQFKIEQEKTAWLAKKELSALLFGPEHPYANNVHTEDYNHVDLQQIRQYHRERINACQCRIFLTGNITPAIYDEVVRLFSKLPLPQKPLATPHYAFHPASPGYYPVIKKDALQSSIRIGKKGVHLLEKDYTGFQLLNTILGGYFGSRLMTNIREEKGYTYGIHSFNVSLPLYSYWGIVADVNPEYTQATIDEIRKEIHKIQREPVSEEELSLVKNYLYGELLRELDGVFGQADALKHKLTYGLDNRFYLQMIEQINRTTASDLMELAQKHLNTDELYVVTVGNPDLIK